MIGQTALLALALVLVPRLTRRSAAERHVCWAVTLAAAGLLPVFTLALLAATPSWVFAAALAVPESLTTLRRWAAGADGDIVVRATGIESSALTFARLVLVCWAAGAALALLRLAAEALRLRRLAASACTDPVDRHHAIAAAVAGSLGVSSPCLLTSEQATVPLTWGMRPRILLPAAALEWTDDRLRLVLAHELAHVRRRDWAVHVAGEVICALYWFHPLFWMTRNRLRRDSEQAADDIVLNTGVTGPDYASALIEIVRAARQLPRPPAAAVAMARESDLKRRVGALLDQQRNRRRATGRTITVTAVLAAIAVTPLAALGLSRQYTSVDVIPSRLPPAVDGISSDETTPPEGVVDRFTPALYSDEARRHRIEGYVTVAVTLDTAGRVTASRVVRGLGFGLDQNALVAVRQWRFQPAMPGDTTVDVEFSLRNEAINELIANDMATRVGPGVTPPRAIRTAEPRPRSGRKGGRVILDVVLLETGVPKIVRILRPVDRELDELAVKVFEQWRFTPAIKDGSRVKVRLTAEVNFRG
jgi:TonB family protein